MSSGVTQKQQVIAQHALQAELFAERYRLLDEDCYGSCFTYSRRRLAAWLERFLPPAGAGKRLLDAGCGTGHQLAWLAQRGLEVCGLDGSPEMLAQARALNPGADIRHADVENVPFPDAGFDLVLCIEVLRYLPDPARCIRELARVLGPGGVCLATAAPFLNLNGYWLVNRLANFMPLGNLVRLKQFFTTSRQLRREFAAAGFKKVEVHGVYLGPINWIERIFPWGLAGTLKRWEPVDAALADHWLLREFSNMFVVRAEK